MRELIKRDVAAPVLSLIFFQGLTTMAMNSFANAPSEVSASYGIPEFLLQFATCQLLPLAFLSVAH